tara:strand:+ start:132 stop:269 length:138 start_codon:yes stop_codon:yes gene_type:complete
VKTQVLKVVNSHPGRLIDTFSAFEFAEEQTNHGAKWPLRVKEPFY